MEGPQSHSKEHQVGEEECKWKQVCNESAGTKRTAVIVNTDLEFSITIPCSFHQTKITVAVLFCC